MPGLVPVGFLIPHLGGGGGPLTPYDTLVLSLGPTRYYPGGQLLGPDLVPYDFLLSTFGPSIWIADGPITDTGPLTSYDELIEDMGPTRYYPGNEVNP